MEAEKAKEFREKLDEFRNDIFVIENLLKGVQTIIFHAEEGEQPCGEIFYAHYCLESGIEKLSKLDESMLAEGNRLSEILEGGK